MFRSVLKKRFNTSQSNKAIKSIKSHQKTLVSNEFRIAVDYKNELQNLKIETSYVDSFWNGICNQLLTIYDDEITFSKFGQNNVIINTMIGDPVRNMSAKFKNLVDFDVEEDIVEEWFGNFRINAPKYNTTGQRLAHIYIANIISSILRDENQEAFSVNEVGGGFGGLAKALEKRIMAGKYAIVDLWQVLPLQRAYLNITRDTNVTEYKFVPVQDNFILRNANVFISNWALTEATMEMQQYVLDSEFFGAQHIFIACQNDNKNHHHGRYLHNYLQSNAKIKLNLSGPMSDSKLFYLRS